MEGVVGIRSWPHEGDIGVGRRVCHLEVVVGVDCTKVVVKVDHQRLFLLEFVVGGGCRSTKLVV